MSPDDHLFLGFNRHKKQRFFSLIAAGKRFLDLSRACTIFTILAVLFSSNAYSATFRVTTKVYSGKSLDPSSKHLILFEEGIVYDFPQIDPRFVTIFDSGKQMVTILDRETQMQTSVTVDDLVKITAQARAAATTEEQKAQVGLNAVVKDSRLVQGYSLAFGTLEYHMTGQKAPSAAVATEFAKFVDLAARLNLVRRLGPPPFGRLTLNQHLSTREEIPLETILLVKRESGSQQYRSTLLLESVDGLSEEDRKRVKEVAGMRAIYRQVDLKSFPNS